MHTSICFCIVLCRQIDRHLKHCYLLMHEEDGMMDVDGYVLV